MKKFATVLILLAGALWKTMGLFVRAMNRVGILFLKEVPTVMTAIGILLVLTAVLLLSVTPVKHKRPDDPASE